MRSIEYIVIIYNNKIKKIKLFKNILMFYILFYKNYLFLLKFTIKILIFFKYDYIFINNYYLIKIIVYFLIILKVFLMCNLFYN